MTHLDPQVAQQALLLIVVDSLLAQLIFNEAGQL